MRPAFLLSKIDDNDSSMPLHYKCPHRAPDETNVFTDGSWVNTLKQYLGLGGAGVWWPQRSTTRDVPGMLWQPVSTGEAMLAHHEQEGDGLVLYTKIGGYAGSSTRKECCYRCFTRTRTYTYWA